MPPKPVKRGDRRTGNRPRPGDSQPCPFCRAGAMQFQDHVAGDGVGPGWFCDNPACGYRSLVRPATTAAKEDGSALTERLAQARRRSMTVHPRAKRLNAESERLFEAERRRRRK